MAKKKMGRPRLVGGAAERPMLLGLRGSPEYGQWLEFVHRKTSIPKTVIVRLALRLWAEHNGHPLPPEI